MWFIAGSIKVALGIVNWEIGRHGGHSGKSLRGLVCPIPQLPIPNAQSNLSWISYMWKTDGELLHCDAPYRYPQQTLLYVSQWASADYRLTVTPPFIQRSRLLYFLNYSCGSNEKMSECSEICLKSLLVGLHLERCSSRVWNAQRPGRLLSISGETAFIGKTNFGKQIQRFRRLWKDGKRENTTETHGTFPKAQKLWCFWAISNVAESGPADECFAYNINYHHNWDCTGLKLLNI